MRRSWATERRHTTSSKPSVSALSSSSSCSPWGSSICAGKLGIATDHAFLAPTGARAFITGALYLVVEIPPAALAVQVIRGFAIPGTLHACTEFGDLVGRGLRVLGATRRQTSPRGNAKPSARARMHSTLGRFDERVAARDARRRRRRARACIRCRRASRRRGRVGTRDG